jgi:hypothetical protein
VVLSCAYDKLVIAWSYLSEKMIHKYERNEQLRCMDYIDTKKMKKLFVGTNRGVILTIDITAELEYDVLGDQDYDMEMDMDYMEQESPKSPKKKGKFEEFESDDGPSITH